MGNYCFFQILSTEVTSHFIHLVEDIYKSNGPYSVDAVALEITLCFLMNLAFLNLIYFSSVVYFMMFPIGRLHRMTCFDMFDY